MKLALIFYYREIFDDSFNLCTPYWSAQIFLFLHVQPFLIEWIKFCFYDSVLVGARRMGEWGDIGQKVQSFSYVG